MRHFSAVPQSAVFDPAVPDAALRILAALATYANKDGWCWPSQESLGKRFGISQQAVARQIGVLVKAGYLDRVKRPAQNGGLMSIYRVKYDRPKSTVPDVTEPATQPDVVTRHNLRRGSVTTQTPESSQPQVVRTVYKELDKGTRTGKAVDRSTKKRQTPHPAVDGCSACLKPVWPGPDALPAQAAGMFCPGHLEGGHALA